MSYVPEVLTLQNGQKANVQLFRGIRYTLIPSSGGQVRISKVDKPTTNTHDQRTVELIGEVVTRTVDWPYLLVEAVGGSVRVSVF